VNKLALIAMASLSIIGKWGLPALHFPMIEKRLLCCILDSIIDALGLAKQGSHPLSHSSYCGSTFVSFRGDAARWCGISAKTF